MQRDTTSFVACLKEARHDRSMSTPCLDETMVDFVFLGRSVLDGRAIG
jgi:hypothetical protein